MSLTSPEYDLVVIGSGPGGQKAAVQGAKAGARVLLVERSQEVGGACVHRGTIPSKALRELARRYKDFSSVQRELGGRVEGDVLQGQDILSRLRPILSAHVGYMEDQIDRNDIDLWRGRASFAGPHEIEVQTIGGGRLRARAKNVVLATGSRPRTPDNVPVDHEHILDSDSVLALSYLPSSMIVLGAGVIGSEYASIFQAFGVQVTLIDSGPRPLRFLDAAIAQGFRESFEAAGGTFIGGQRASEVQWDGFENVEVTLTDGTRLRAAKLMVAAGRLANLEALRLERAGLEATERGILAVDKHYRTAVPHIFAVGDIIGPPSLASSSMEQGRHAACAALGLPTGETANTVPAGIYTLPELGCVGLSEEQARETHGGATVGIARFSEVARGRISNNADGLLKLVADKEGRRLLGVHVVGEGAAELVHVGQMALLQGADVDLFIRNVFNFPTLAEAYRVAAFEIVKTRAPSPVG